MTGERPIFDWDWTIAHLDGIVFRLAQHLWLAAIAVAAGFVIAFALALWARRSPRVAAPIVLVAGVLYTIPSLALFAALVPFTGFSLLTAEIPLTAYTLLILFRNIHTGLTSIPADVLEAADATGHHGRERLLRVELPLAIPMILAGIRLASVSTIGLVMVVTLIGDNFGGLGLYIKEGIQTFFATKVYVGAGLSIALAIVVDLALVRVERRIAPWSISPARREATA